MQTPMTTKDGRPIVVRRPTPTANRRSFLRAAAVLPLVALPPSTPDAPTAAAPDPRLADGMRYLARHLPVVLDGMGATYTEEGDRGVLAGEGWRLSAARTAGGLDLRLDGVADADLRFVALGFANLLRALAPLDAMPDPPLDGEGAGDELRALA